MGDRERGFRQGYETRMHSGDRETPILAASGDDGTRIQRGFTWDTLTVIQRPAYSAGTSWRLQYRPNSSRKVSDCNDLMRSKNSTPSR